VTTKYPAPTITRSAREPSRPVGNASSRWATNAGNSASSAMPAVNTASSFE
jgi:hypothetical protein